MNDLWRMTATEASRRIRAGDLTASELMASCLERAAEREPVVHAFTHLDPSAAMARAGEVDRTVTDAPLRGIPFAVKDVFDTADAPTGYGSPIWNDHHPRADASAVSLARSAGAVMMGKAVTTEFAMLTPGPTANPANPLHTPGGSSSGSAAAVAYGACPLAFGTQTGGSVIRPAAYCGIVGYKPTFGMIHRGGARVMSESLDTIGVFARSVADCALFVSSVTGSDLGNPEAAPGRVPTIAFCLGPAADRASPETLAMVDRAMAAASEAGASVETIALPQAAEDAFAIHSEVMFGEMSQAMAWEMRVHRDLVSPALRERLDWGADLPIADLQEAVATMNDAREAMAEVFAGVDAIVTPSAPGEAPEGLWSTGDFAFNKLWTALHGPCISVPAGTGAKGLPLGIQLVAAPGSDREILAWAEWLRNAMA
jgi:amidase